MKPHSRRQFLRTGGTAAAGLGVFSILGRASAQTGAAQRPPNILLVFPDQLRRDWNSILPGIAVHTPRLAQFVQQGMRFERAYCPSPLCAPSRACLAQGRRYGRTGVTANEANNPDDVDTFYQHLGAAGYSVGTLGKLDMRKGAYDWGPDGMHRVGGRCYFQEWGFTHGFDSEGKIDVVLGVQKLKAAGRTRPEQLNPYARMLAERRDGSLEAYLGWYKAWREGGAKFGNYAYTQPCELTDAAYNDNWVGGRAVKMVASEFPEDRPWFLQVNFPGPHNPLDITPPMAQWYQGASFPAPIKNDQLAAATHQDIRRSYSAMVDNIDRWFGKLLDAVEERGAAGNTLVVFASDHGEMLGDHDRWGKTLPYQASASVPLVVRGPGVARNATHRRVATTLDLPATFLDFAGVPVPAAMDSRSLRPVLSGARDVGRSHITCGLEPWRMVVEERYKLVRGFDPDIGGNVEAQKKSATESGAVPPLLFDLKADPQELDNAAGRLPEVVARLEALLPPPPAA